MPDEKPPAKAGSSEPVIDDLGYAGPWGDAKPGEVLPGFSTDPAQRKRDLTAGDERERQRDMLGDQIARISAELGAARRQGDAVLVERLREEQRRLTLLQLSI